MPDLFEISEPIGDLPAVSCSLSPRDDEDDLRDFHRQAGDTAEAQHGCNQGNHQESDGPSEHDISPTVCVAEATSRRELLNSLICSADVAGWQASRNLTFRSRVPGDKELKTAD